MRSYSFILRFFPKESVAKWQQAMSQVLATTSIMLLSNNAEINADEVNAKLKAVALHRRRSAPLFASSDANVGTRGRLAGFGLRGGSSTTLRGIIKEIPVVGTFMVNAYRRFREMLAPGLHWKQRMRLFPFFGSLAAWTYSIIRLNAVRHKIAVELTQLRQMQEAHQVNTHNAIEQIDARIKNLEAMQIDHRLNRLDAADIPPRLDQLDQFSRAIATSNMERDNRLSSMTRELRRVTEVASTAQPTFIAPASNGATNVSETSVSIETAGSDSFYIEFEDAFRGTREEITGRLKVYLPYLERLIGDETAHVIDVGCGRGEWIALLTELGIKATGIDMNNAMVDACHEAGLQAECMDAIQYLRQQPEGSLSAVTGFHIIEHLPFKILLSLFDAALHALKPEGLIIFETPNPENLIVGACNFYYDPTHLNPIVPVVAEFIARQRGFAYAEILRLHPYPQSHRVIEDSEMAKRFNDAMYGPQDYAVLAWKTHAN